MRPALVYSVPGTGTRFTFELLWHLGYDRPIVAHVGQIEVPVFAWTVIPLRSPGASYLSSGAPEQLVVSWWTKLLAELPELNHVLLPIEDERVPRAERVARVARFLEAEPGEGLADFVEAWPRVGSNLAPGEVRIANVGFLSELEARYQELLDRYVVQ